MPAGGGGGPAVGWVVQVPYGPGSPNDGAGEAGPGADREPGGLADPKVGAREVPSAERADAAPAKPAGPEPYLATSASW